MQLSRNRLRALFLIGLLVGLSVGANGAVVFLDSEYTVTEGVIYAASNGPEVTIGSATTVRSGSYFADSQTVELQTGIGNATFSSAGHTEATLDHSGGTWTNVSALNVTDRPLTVTSTGQSKVAVQGQTNTLNVTEVDTSVFNDGEVDFVYSGTSGNTSLTVYGLSSNSALKVVDVDSGTVLGTGTTDSNGVVTFDMPNSEHRADVQVQSDPPYVEASSPRNNEYLDNRSVSLNATVRDPDGFDVTAEVYFYNQTSDQFELVKTETVASGGTVTAQVEAFPGSNRWYVELESAADGETRTSSTYRFRTSGVIEVRDATDRTLITGTAVNYTITGINSDFRTVGTTTTGTFDLTGVPEERVQVKVGASGYSNGTLVIDDPSDSPDVLLQPSGANESYEQTFALDDLTGNFPATDTVLVVEQYYSDQWTTIGSNTFGADNRATFNLTDGQDYRLTVRNSEGDIRQLSVFEANLNRSDEIVLLTIEQVRPPEGDFGDLGYSWDAFYTDPDGSQAYLRFVLASQGETAVDNLQIRIYEQDNEQNVLYENNFGLAESLVVTQPLSAAQKNKTWVLVWNGTVGDNDVEGRIVLGEYQQKIGISQFLSTFWMQVMSVGFLIVSGALFGGLRSRMGAVVIALSGGLLWYLGLMPTAVAGGAIVATVFVAGLVAAARQRGVGI